MSEDGFSRFLFNPSRIFLLSLLIGLPDEFGSAAGRVGMNAAMALISASLSCCSFRFLLDFRCANSWALLLCSVGILCQSSMVSGGCVLARWGFWPAGIGSGFSAFNLTPLPLICAGIGGTGGLSSSRGTRMLSLRPGEKLYVRRCSGSRCSFFESFEDFRFVSRRLLLLSGPAEANSGPLCFARSRSAPVSCISDFGFSAPPVDLLLLLLLRKGHMPMFPFVCSTV
jgi:hypothetical protein